LASHAELGEATHGLQAHAMPAAPGHAEPGAPRADTGTARSAATQSGAVRVETQLRRSLAPTNSEHGPGSLAPRPMNELVQPIQPHHSLVHRPIEGIAQSAFNLGLQPMLMSGTLP